jgi:hypothetical protein
MLGNGEIKLDDVRQVKSSDNDVYMRNSLPSVTVSKLFDVSHARRGTDIIQPCARISKQLRNPHKRFWSHLNESNLSYLSRLESSIIIIVYYVMQMFVFHSNANLDYKYTTKQASTSYEIYMSAQRSSKVSKYKIKDGGGRHLGDQSLILISNQNDPLS